MMNLNLKQLEVFAAVVQCQSFTDAARNLYLSQSTVSGHVAAMEKELGVVLFERNGKKKTVLTAQGKKIYAHARMILQSCEDLENAVHQHTAHELIVAASTIPGEYLLPEYLSGFLKINPQCQMTLVGRDSAGVHEMIMNGAAYLGFAGAVLNRHELMYDLLCEDRLVLITPDTEFFREMHNKGVCGNELLSYPLIFREDGSGTQQAVDKFLCENNIRTENIHPAARMNNTTSVIQCVAKGCANALISALAAQNAPGVLIFPLEGTAAVRHLYMVHAKGRHLPGIAKQFYDYILENIRQ